MAKIVSIESRKKKAEAYKGKHFSPVTEFKKGHKFSEETLQKISNSKKGKHYSLKTEFKRGIHSSPKTEFKQGNHPKSEFKKGHKGSEEQKRKVSMANKGHPPHEFNEKTKRKMSESHRGYIPWNKGLKNCFTKETIKKILTRRIPSSLEKKFQHIVDKHDLPYKYVGNGNFFIEGYNPDFINTNGEKIAVEVYANYYKLRDERTIEEYKAKRVKTFAEYGWKVLFFNEIELKEQNILTILGGKEE